MCTTENLKIKRSIQYYKQHWVSTRQYKTVKYFIIASIALPVIAIKCFERDISETKYNVICNIYCHYTDFLMINDNN